MPTLANIASGEVVQLYIGWLGIQQKLPATISAHYPVWSFGSLPFASVGSLDRFDIGFSGFDENAWTISPPRAAHIEAIPKQANLESR